MEYNDYVKNSILANNRFGITDVNQLESLKTIFYVKDEYGEVERLIESNNIKALKALPEGQPRTEEYLDVMSFSDQKENAYIVTVYDSDALEQDPQVIKIYSI